MHGNGLILDRVAKGGGRALRVLFGVVCGLASFQPAWAARTDSVVVSVPGPRNLSYLPIELIARIGADREEGLDVRLLHTGGGAVALNHLLSRNADFAVAGMPAAMSLRAHGGDVVVVAAVNDAPLFVLMVRTGLKDRVKRIADLKGLVIGVNTSTRASKTTSQQLAELLLLSGGIASDDVRIVPAGQSWQEQSSLLLTATADAVMGDEPFASRLREAGQVYFLANLADPHTVRGIKGVNFLHAALEVRGETIRHHPERVARMVRALRRTLVWMQQHSPEEIVGKLDVQDAAERNALLGALRRYPRAFSRDGRLSVVQLAETEAFFHAGGPLEPGSPPLTYQSMVNTRWAGLSE